VYEDGIDQPRCMDRADLADVNGNGNTTEVLRFHYHQQALGSVTEMTQPTGAVVEWVTYDAYGKPTIRDRNGVVVTQSAVGNPYLFTGREYDPETGLFFYRARHYDPATGRFLQRDPLGNSPGAALHDYVASKPTVWVDPDGLQLKLPMGKKVVKGKRVDTGEPDRDAVHLVRQAAKAAGLETKITKDKESSEFYVEFIKPKKTGKSDPKKPTSSTLQKYLLTLNGKNWELKILGGEGSYANSAEGFFCVARKRANGDPYEDFWSGVYVFIHEIGHMFGMDETDATALEDKVRHELGWPKDQERSEKRPHLPGEQPQGPGRLPGTPRGGRR